MQPITRPVAGPARIQMCLRQQPQDREVVLAPHHGERWSTQRRDRDRPSVVRVVLVRPARPQQPHPRRQRRRHIHDTLTRTDELLREQIAEPGRRLDRPPPLGEGLRPTQKQLELTLPRADVQLREFVFVVVDRARRVRQLVRIDPDDHCHDRPFNNVDVEP